MTDFVWGNDVWEKSLLLYLFDKLHEVKDPLSLPCIDVVVSLLIALIKDQV